MAGSRVSDCVNAAVDALKADTNLATILGADKVFTHIPQGTAAPYTLVIGGDETPWNVTFGDDSGARQVDVVVQCVSTYRGSSQVDSIASRVMEVLLDNTSWTGSVLGFQLADFMRNAAQPPIDLNNDGVLYFVRYVTVKVSLD